ncbi:hypothetical protein LG307_02575 [Sutcliffiella horikoshii]|uniref:hypothetical protein n=1 Tax=Sutcliffiella horikoshii TaxID=79883 RepID=UPI00384B1F4B
MLKLLVGLLLMMPLQPLNTESDSIASNYKSSGFTTVEKATFQYEKQSKLHATPPESIPFKPTHSFGRYIDRGYYKGKLQLEYVDSSNMDVLVVWIAEEEHEDFPFIISKQLSLNGGISGTYMEGKDHACVSKLAFEYEGSHYMIEYIRALSMPYVKEESLIEVANSIIH